MNASSGLNAPSGGMIIRLAEAKDAPSIAALHAVSWRTFYRGALPEQYLAGDLLADRQRVWASRLSSPAPNQRVFLAVSGTELLGFACVFLAADEQWGALLDNLHVAEQHQRRGIGAMLLRKARARIKMQDRSGRIHLWVLESNTQARAFYESMGASVVGTDRWDPPGAGAPVPRFRMAWVENAA